MTSEPKKKKAEEPKSKADKPVKRQKATRPKKGKSFNLHEHIAGLQRQMGTCENGKQMVCKFDDSMMPSDCSPENCS
jgi:hypothetical protein